MLNRDNMTMGRVSFNQLPKEIQDNIDITIERVNQLIQDIPPTLPFKVNDGYRRPTDTPKHGSITSWHLKGAAVDIDDDSNQSYWLAIIQYARSSNKSITQLLAEYKLYVENPRWTPGWLHFQINPPRSGSRVFVPSLAKPLTNVALE